jgi:hypothetical protein
MWVLIVASQRMSITAISLLERPRARSVSTSVSRSVSPSSPRCGRVGRWTPHGVFDQAPRERWREECVAGSDDADSGDELVARHVLEQEAAGTGTHNN